MAADTFRFSSRARIRIGLSVRYRFHLRKRLGEVDELQEKYHRVRGEFIRISVRIFETICDSWVEMQCSFVQLSLAAERLRII